MPMKFPGIARISLRFKLTLWMTLIFLVIQLSLVLVLQLYQHRSVDAFFDARILARQGIFAAELRPSIATLTDFQLQEFAERNRVLLLQTMLVLQTFDDSGTLLASSLPSRPPLQLSQWQALSTAHTPLAFPARPELVAISGVGAARSAAGPVIAANGKTYYLLVAWSDVYALEILRQLSSALLLTIPISITAVMISAYAISGVALQPIHAMRQMARSLDPEHLSEANTVPITSSEVAELHRDLEKTRQKLDAAFAAQERFMTNVSHEHKTPIAVLTTEAQTLRLDNAPNEVRAFVTSCTDELDKLGRMVDSFLLLTRVRHGKTQIPNRERCLVREILLSSYESCAAMAVQHGVRIALHLPDGPALDASVDGNADLLRTVIDNLLRNAIRFSPKQGVVELTTTINDSSVAIVVRDHGQGIAPAVIPHIFDRFFQSKEEQRRGRGHGLGLEIALGITELHGGSIVARNREDGGSEFVVTLPLAATTLSQEVASA